MASKLQIEENAIMEMGRRFGYVGECTITWDNTQKKKTRVFTITPIDDTIIMTQKLLDIVKDEMKQIGYECLGMQFQHKTIEITYRNREENN